MRCASLLAGLLVGIALVPSECAWAGQVPGSASDVDIPVSHRDRVYAAGRHVTHELQPSL
jgi:hypothetical protein